jgi:hypothetical protein
MQRVNAPGRAISWLHISGTSFQPKRSRAATAGNSAIKSGLVLNCTDATSSCSMLLTCMSLNNNSSVAFSTSLADVPSAVVAPFTPRTFVANLFLKTCSHGLLVTARQATSTDILVCHDFSCRAGN